MLKDHDSLDDLSTISALDFNSYGVAEIETKVLCTNGWNWHSDYLIFFSDQLFSEILIETLRLKFRIRIQSSNRPN